MIDLMYLLLFAFEVELMEKKLLQPMFTVAFTP